MILFFSAMYNFACAAATVDDLLAEFAGRGNIMAGAEVCGLEERHIFKKQSMQLIEDSELDASGQAELKKAFQIEYKDGLDFYKKYTNDGCDSVKSQIQPMTAEEIKIWKLMSLN